MTKSLYLTFEEAALMLKLHHTTIRQRKAGTEMLTHVPQGRRRFLLRSEVEALQQRAIKHAKEVDQERKSLLRLAS
jgi:hypothetical protein